MKAAEFAALLGGKQTGKWWACPCPAHADSTPSLHVTDGDSALVFTCKAGCDKTHILTEMGLTWGDIYDGTYDPTEAHWRSVRRRGDAADRLANEEALWDVEENQR